MTGGVLVDEVPLELTVGTEVVEVFGADVDAALVPVDVSGSSVVVGGAVDVAVCWVLVMPELGVTELLSPRW